MKDATLEELEVKFIRPMYNNTARNNDVNYSVFRDSLFDIDKVFIWIAKILRPIKFGQHVARQNSMIVIRKTAQNGYEIELCGKSTVNTVVVNTSIQTLQQYTNSLEFLEDDFKCQPNPFGTVRTRHRNGL